MTCLCPSPYTRARDRHLCTTQREHSSLMSPWIPLSTWIQQSTADLHSHFIRKRGEELKDVWGRMYAYRRAIVWCLWMYNWRSDLCEHTTLCCCLQYARPKRWWTLSSLSSPLSLYRFLIPPPLLSVLYDIYVYTVCLSFSLYHIRDLLPFRLSFKGSNRVNYLITSVSTSY